MKPTVAHSSICLTVASLASTVRPLRACTLVVALSFYCINAEALSSSTSTQAMADSDVIPNTIHSSPKARGFNQNLRGVQRAATMIDDDSTLQSQADDSNAEPRMISENLLSVQNVDRAAETTLEKADVLPSAQRDGHDVSRPAVADSSALHINDDKKKQTEKEAMVVFLKFLEARRDDPAGKEAMVVFSEFLKAHKDDPAGNAAKAYLDKLVDMNLDWVQHGYAFHKNIEDLSYWAFMEFIGELSLY